MNEIFDIVIIGAGPGGMSAALYALRSNRKVLIIEKRMPGGKLNDYVKLENYPGVFDKSAPDLGAEFLKQITSLGLEVTYGTVTDVKKEHNLFTVRTEDAVYTGKSVIVASGTSEKVLGVAGESEFTGRGVSYCATCDAAFFKGQPVAVVGNSNSAAREALYLTEIVGHVSFLYPGDHLNIEDKLADELQANPKITLIKNAIVYHILGDKKVNALKYRCCEDEHKLAVSAVFPFIGSRPNTSFIAHEEVMDSNGFLIVNENMETSIPGLYGIGDAVKKTLRQIITAASDGAVAAFKAQQYCRKIIL